MWIKCSLDIICKFQRGTIKPVAVVKFLFSFVAHVKDGIRRKMPGRLDCPLFVEN